MSQEPACPIDASVIEAKLAEFGLKAGAQTLAGLQTAVADLEAAADNIRRPRGYLEEPAHALRLPSQ
ncbi:MAG: hypothetical protein ACYC0T_04820 [Ramlibacter sp.]